MIRIIAISAVAFAMTGCASTEGSELARQALGNLEHCKRTYQAAIGALGAPGGSLYIECEPRPFDTPSPDE